MLSFLMAIVLVEALTELVIKSVLFKPLRTFLGSKSVWLKELFSCGYCFSVWGAAAVVLVLGLPYTLTGNWFIDFGVTFLVVHRLSNYLHNFVDCWLDKYYNVSRVSSAKLDE